MRKAVLMITAIFLLLIDQTVMPFLSIYGTYASMLFTFFALFSLKTDFEDAVTVGIITGILQDLYFPYGFGLHTLFNIILFLGLSKLGSTLKEGRKSLPIIFVALAHGFKTMAIILILRLFGILANPASIMLIPLYTVLLSLILYRVVHNFERIPVIKKEWKF